jgi:NADPH:quinone reductase-like Zn-dependent oxidoreductase
MPEPEGLGPHELLVRPRLCGICGTDLHEYLAGPIVTPAQPHPLTGATNPQILGHEFSAEVLEVGGEVTAALTIIGTWCYRVYDRPRIAAMIAGGSFPARRWSAHASGFSRPCRSGSTCSSTPPATR